MTSKLSAYRMWQVWSEKSKHLSPDSEIVKAITRTLETLYAMEQEDDRVAEAELLEKQERESIDDDIPF